MSAIAPLVLTDLQPTPVEKTFNPVQSGNLSIWRESDSTIPVMGRATMLMQINEARGNDGVDVFKITHRVPVLESIGTENAEGYVAAPKVAYYLLGTLEFKIPRRATLAQRQQVRRYLTDMMYQSNPLSGALYDLEVPY